jgi:predicted DNA-binding transcriptional regulator YafY
MTTEEIIHEAGQKLLTVIFDYTEADGTNEGQREVEPYSYRDKSGRKFMGYDLRKSGIRAFIPENIHNISITDNKFEPRWPVEV